MKFIITFTVLAYKLTMDHKNLQDILQDIFTTSVQSHLSNTLGSIHVVRTWRYWLNWLKLRPLLRIQVLHTSLVKKAGLRQGFSPNTSLQLF